MGSQLLERSRLLAELDRAVADRSGRVVLVAGETGIGKSALVRWFIRRHERSVRFLVGLCDPLLTARTLGPLRDIAGQLGGGLAGRLAAGVAREEIFAALLEELLRYDGPQAVVVEDVQWADEATMDLLVVLSRRLERLPVLLVLTFRDDELAANHPLYGVLSKLPAERTLRVRPAPLSEAAVAELAVRAGRAATGVHAVTGGNPLLVTEVLTSDEPGVPTTIRDLVLARLAALPQAAQQVVRFVSVIPTRTELWVLKQALGPAPAVVEDCVASGLLMPDGDAVGFRHELIRQAVEQSLSVLRHEELNRLALRVLSGGSGVDLARLAHHARQSGDGAAVVHYAPKAAQEAQTAGAHRQALEHYRAALRHADDLPGPLRADLLEGCSLNAYLTGHTDEALSTRVAALRIREAAGQTGQVGRNLCWLSRLHWWAGRHGEADTAAARAIAVLEPAGASQELAMAYSNRAQLDVLARELTSAIEWSSRAIVLAEQVGDRETVAHALTSIGTALQAQGDRAGRAELERAIEIAMGGNLPHHTARAMANLAITTMELGDTARALQDLDRALAFAREHELATYALYLLGHRALWRLNRGDWTGAETDARDVLAQTGRPTISEVPALIALGRLQARRGDAAATGTLREAARVALDTGEPQRVAPVVAVRVEHAWLCGEPDRAVTEAAMGFELVRRTRHPWFAGELAWWLHRAGQQPDVPEWIAQPYRLLLNGHWDGAAIEWEQRGYPYEQGEALACSDHEDAHRQALEIFDRLGAVPAATRLRRRLRGQGRRVPRGPRAATAANPAHLTARQMEVLTQLATGVGNAAIARRLSLSVRTVDHHVAGVLAKLSAHSRDDAVAAARRLGIIPAQDGLPPTAN